MISNGPGDPTDVPETIETVKALRGKYPIFGICLGHQILSLAYGARTYKLKFGHRGGNHPVRDLATGRIEITSQNHSYAVDAESLTQTELTVTHVKGHRVDPGVNNFLATASNYGETPYLIRGGAIKSWNQWYNKKRSVFMKQLTKGKDSRRSIKDSRRLDALSRKKDERMRDFFYKCAHFICRSEEKGVEGSVPQEGDLHQKEGILKVIPVTGDRGYVLTLRGWSVSRSPGRRSRPWVHHISKNY